MRKRSSIKGFSEAADVMKQLPPRVQNRVLQKGANAAARVFLSAFKAAVPRGKDSPLVRKLKGGQIVDYGKWYQNMKVRVMKRLRSRTARGAQVYTGNAFWAMFYEFGTAHEPARPILRTTSDANMEKATLAMRTAIGKGIETEVQRLVKQP